MKRQLLVMFIILVALMPLSAATVSVLVIETGLPPQGMFQSASVWESGVMDAFFDAGFIVSNAPSMQLDRITGTQIPIEARSDFEQARVGGSDFFVMVHIDYPYENMEGAEQSKKVSIAIYRVSTGHKILETSITDRIWKDPKEEFSVAKRNAGQLIRRINING